jgi:hypothetical protein
MIIPTLGPRQEGRPYDQRADYLCAGRAVGGTVFLQRDAVPPVKIVVILPLVTMS